MEIDIKLLEKFALKRLQEEKDKGHNMYTCLNGNGCGMHYYDHIIDAIPYIFEDISYALKHPDVIEKTEKSINDYGSAKEAIDNLYKYCNGYIGDFTVIIGDKINRYHMSTLAIKKDFSCEIIDELVHYQGYDMKWIDEIMDSKSYHLMYFDDHRSLSLLIHA